MTSSQSPIPNPQSHLPIAIIGGGITGLTAAWELQKAGVSYVLLEQSARFGGKIQTEHIDGFGDAPFIIERAGDAFLAAQKPWAMELAYELGLDEQILTTNSVQPSVYILKDGELIPVPAGLQLIIPTNREAFLASPLLSADGKARVLAEKTVDPYLGDDDESIADFVRRRMGDEAIELLAEPLLSGIYSAHPEEQSLLATFPRYRQLEQKFGSLIGGARMGERRGEREKGGKGVEEKKPLTAFISFRGGTEILVKELAARLTGDLRLNTGVSVVQNVSAACSRTASAEPDNLSQSPKSAATAQLNSPSVSSAYILHLDNGATVHADHIIITTPAATAARMVRSIASSAADQLQKLRVVSTGVVFLAYRREQVTHPLNGFGVVIPRRERRSINAMTWMTTKFDHRAPAGHVLIRVFFGGARTPAMIAKNDEEVLAVAQAELRDLLALDAAPVLHRVYRWINAQPQYDVGHLERMARIFENLPPNIHIAGSPYGGVGIPDCVRQGREAAREVIENLF